MRPDRRQPNLLDVRIDNTFVSERGAFIEAVRPVAPLFAIVATSRAPGWRVQGSYTGFHSSVNDLYESRLLPNTPGHQFSIGMAYERARISRSVRYRWVDAFTWLAGMYGGPVPSYGVLDLNGSYRLTSHITAGADVANLLDNHHYEAFGARTRT